MMLSSLKLEFSKMRRLRTPLILSLMILAVVALSSASLFSAGLAERIADPQSNMWEALLLSYTMMSAMTSPIFMAVLASRQTDIEHSANGWILAGTNGQTPGQLCRNKLLALGLILLPFNLLQTLLSLGMGMLVNIQAPLHAAPWLGYTVCLYSVNLVFIAFHVWLSTVVENQLVSVGVGVFGAFISVFMLLLPSVFSRFIPWGYFAVISWVRQSDQGVAYIVPPLGWVGAFFILGMAVFFFTTKAFDRQER
ncbi:MAG: ABC transporter permease [Rothia sp. (in: high G+C Gram-positive bacteria)]|nr:ABC transporter permease [Rothia sp. (in: high G+C Gram-positive bacteria)]